MGGGELRLTRRTKWTSIFRSRTVGARTVTSSLRVAISQQTATAAVDLATATSGS